MNMKVWAETQYDEFRGGKRRTVSASVDLAQSVVTGQAAHRLTYKHFDSAPTIDLMARQADWWAQFGEQAPSYRSTLVVARGDADQAFVERYDRLEPPSFQGVQVVSADVAEMVILRQALSTGELTVVDGRQVIARTRASPCAVVLAQLKADGRMLFRPVGKADFRTGRTLPDQIDFIGPLSRCAGYISDEARLGSASLAFNSGFYILPEEEFNDDPFEFAYDPVGLVVSGGVTFSPPVYRRAAIIAGMSSLVSAAHHSDYDVNNCVVEIDDLDLQSLRLVLPSGDVIHGGAFPSTHGRLSDGRMATHFLLNPSTEQRGETESEVFGFTRTSSMGSSEITTDVTPQSVNRVELVLSGRAVCGYKLQGGETFIPRNGWVLSIPADSPRVDVPALIACIRDGCVMVEQQVCSTNRALIQDGTQVWTRAISDGSLALPLDTQPHKASGEFVPIGHNEAERGLPPVHLYDRYLDDDTRSVLAAGVSADGRLLLTLVEGCEPRSMDLDTDSVGGSAVRVAVTLLNLGAREGAILDSGGAAQLVVNGRHVVRPADRNDVPHAPYLRLAPGAWMVEA